MLLRNGLIALVITAAFPALAHDHATGVVKERMEMMEAMAKRMKAIRARIAAKRDLAAIKGDAEAITAHASHTAHLFPPGSMQRPTDAKAAIWRNWGEFERMAGALEAESRKLAQVSASDLDSLSRQFRAVSQTCGGCHEKYRTKR